VLNIIVNPQRITAERDIKVYGHFLEHFHRQIYGGVFEPGSKRSDANGLRTDVLEAMRRIKPPVIRWPGGCFVSSYDWKAGVGLQREPVYDKAWRVEEPNTFGTDEFHALCEALDAQMYICANAGTGSMEQMSDWLEYTNLASEGRYARQRIRNGHEKPYGVPYFSIGNENYGSWELGAKERHEWARLVTESAKLLKHVDPTVELSAAALPDPAWNLELLEHAGPYLSWISIHEYWDMIHTTNALATYEQAMAYTAKLDDSINRVEGILAATGYSDKIKIAFDEWNLRGWYHPNSHGPNLSPQKAMYINQRDQNDRNESYTMADTVFTACFLNTLLRHARSVKMANYAPSVNTRGLIYTHPDGIVLRGTYHVFDLFVNHMGERIIDLWAKDECVIDVTDKEQNVVPVSVLDAVATLRKDGRIALSLVNKHPQNEIRVSIAFANGENVHASMVHSIQADSTEAYNDIDTPDRIGIHTLTPMPNKPIVLAPHSVNVLLTDQLE